jgi:hypothetical protein
MLFHALNRIDIDEISIYSIFAMVFGTGGIAHTVFANDTYKKIYFT